MILLALGVIIGLLINPIRKKIEIKLNQDAFVGVPQGKTQFFDSVSNKEKFNKAKDLGDLI